MDSVDHTLSTVLRNWIDVFMRRSMRNFVLYSKEKGLSMTQIATLIHIRRKGVRSVSEISEELQITSPAASQLLERLVQQGLIMRSEDPNDRRLKQIALSQEGEMLLKKGLHERMNWLDDLVKLLSPEEKKLVTAALSLLLEKARELEDQQTPEC